MRILTSGLVLAVLLGSTNMTFAGDGGAISNARVKYEDGRIDFAVEVHNLLNGRLKGALCATLFDGEGFVIDNTRVGPDFNLGKDDQIEIAYGWWLKAGEYDDLAKIDLYIASFCMLGVEERYSVPVSLPKPE